MKIVLISFHKELVSMGIRGLHYYLLKNQQQSFILFLPNINCAKQKELEVVGKFILELRPDLIGISLVSVEYHNASNLTRYLKTLISTTPVIWGGDTADNFT